MLILPRDNGFIPTKELPVSDSFCSEIISIRNLEASDVVKSLSLDTEDWKGLDNFVLQVPGCNKLKLIKGIYDAILYLTFLTIDSEQL